MDRFGEGHYVMPRERKPWTPRRVTRAMAVALALTGGAAAVGPTARDWNERSWCGMNGGQRAPATYAACMAEQKACRSGPLDVFHTCGDAARD